MSVGLIIFCYCICAYGACNVIVYGSGPFKIFEHIRNIAMEIGTHFGSLFSCMMCLPTNFGIICSLINWFFIDIAFTPFNILFGANPSLWWLAMLCDGAFTSGIVWLIHHVEEFFEVVSENGKNNPNNDTLYNDNEVINADDITFKN
jgi:hypothetical protein